MINQQIDVSLKVCGVENPSMFLTNLQQCGYKIVSTKTKKPEIPHGAIESFSFEAFLSDDCKIVEESLYSERLEPVFKKRLIYNLAERILEANAFVFTKRRCNAGKGELTTAHLRVLKSDENDFLELSK